MIIYVSSPFSEGNQVHNIYVACKAGDEILKRGHIPFIPHLLYGWHVISPKEWGEWIRIDMAYLSMCDALLRLPGKSKGADIEVAEADNIGIPVFYSIENIPKKNR